jgi:hypothetical protein
MAAPIFCAFPLRFLKTFATMMHRKQAALKAHVMSCVVASKQKQNSSQESKGTVFDFLGACVVVSFLNFRICIYFPEFLKHVFYVS